MGRTPKGKPLTLRPIRLDEDVWAQCQRLGREHGTINEGLRSRLIENASLPQRLDEVAYGSGDGSGPELVSMGLGPLRTVKPTQKRVVEKWRRPPRQKGDKSR